MQLLCLRIKNLNSLKGEHSINFSEGALSQTGLFAITGPTGAGKSTILDAITLALYNQTPRSGSVSKNDIAQLGSIITRNTNEAWAELDFQIKDKVYRSQWGISRNRNGNLRDYSLILSEKNTEGNFVALDFNRSQVPAENTRLIGLSFDQFLRSILLSQGDFARFLKSTANERGELLEKITGTEIYRIIGQRAFLKQKEEWIKLDKLKQQLEGIELLDSDERASIISQTDILQKQNQELETELNQLNKHKQILSDYKSLGNNIAAKNEQLSDHSNQIKQFEPQQQSINIHQKLLPLKTDIVSIQNITKDIEELSLESENQTSLISKLSVKDKQLNEQLSRLNNEKETTLRNETSLQAIIAQVRQLDSQIKLETSKHKDQQERLKNEEEEVESLNKSCKNIDAKLESLEAELSKLKQYLESHSELENLESQLPALQQQYTNLKAAETSVGNKVERMDESPTRTSLLQDAALKVRINIIEKAIASSSEFLNKNKAKLQIEKGQKEKFTSEKEELQKQIPVIDKLIDLSNEISELEKQVKHLQQTLKENNLIITKDDILLNNHIKAIKINSIKTEELKHKHERELLEAKYDEARQLLKPNEACPLCGSEDHPFVKEYQSSINQTKQQLQACLNEDKRLITEKERLIEHLSKLKSEHERDTKQHSQSTQLLNNNIAFFKVLIKDINSSISWNDINKLTELKANKEEHIQTMNVQLRLYDQIEQATQRNKEFISIQTELKTLEIQEKDLDSKLLKFQNTTKTLSIDKQLVELNNQHHTFKTKKEQILSLEKELSNQNTLWKEKSETLNNKVVALAKTNEAFAIQENTLKSLVKERKTLFGDKNPDLAEKELINQKDKLYNQLKSCELEQKEISTSIITSNKRTAELKVLLEKKTSTLNNQKEKLSQQLAAFSISSIEQANELLLSEDKISELMAKADALRKTDTELKQSLKDLSLQLSNIETQAKSIKYSEEELSSLLQEKNQLLKSQLGTCGSLKEKIAQDDKNKIKQADKVKVIQAQEKEFNRWKALSNLMGDAQGNTFAKFAQELTLHQVIYLANIHLKKLSDRYIVKHVKTDKLDDLFVVDSYHGDAERSVKTLSGGESFLVSLSLALGLSDLAGQNTTIGSLFIDEGFGTLDQNTLDIALSALEKLQNESNRTIGIISHVPALKERVTTQIELSKNASGYSSLQIRS